MNRVLAWLDNPILVKHIRCRMRGGQFLPASAVVIILCLLISWGGWMLDGYANGGTFGALLALQTVVLLVMGASQVSASLSAARESGIIDFHRVSPLSPLELTIGFFLGAPIREYILFGCTLPFSLFCVAMGAPEFSGLVQILIALILGAWLLNALALLNALTLKRPKAAARGIVGVLLFVLLFSGVMVQGYSRATALVNESPTLSFYGLALPWLVFVIIYAIPTLTFLLMAATRKMRSDRAHVFSKPQSVACLTTLTVLILGALWGVQGLEYGALVVLYALVATAMGLT